MYNKIHGNAFEDIQKYWKKFNSNKEVEEEFHDARSEWEIFPNPAQKIHIKPIKTKKHKKKYNFFSQNTTDVRIFGSERLEI